MQRRFALFGVLFLTLVVLACLGTQSPAWAQSAPGETIPPDATPVYLPIIAVAQPAPTSTIPPRAYSSVPVGGGSIGRPAQESADVNLALRSYAPTSAYLGLVNYGGDTDSDAPQVAQMFSPERLPAFVGAHQVYDLGLELQPAYRLSRQPDHVAVQREYDRAGHHAGRDAGHPGARPADLQRWI